MVYVPGSNVLQVEIRGLQNGQEVENVLYFENSGAISGTEVENLFDYIESDFIPAYLAEIAGATVIDELYATDLTTSSSPTYSRSFSPALAGDLADNVMPGNVTLCISFRSNNRGRSSRGRNYVYGITEPDVEFNNASLGLINALVAAYELFLVGAGIPAGWEWVVFSRFLNNAPRVAGLAQTIVDVLSTSTTVDSQRGRLT